jgi:hypothetical protein
MKRYLGAAMIAVSLLAMPSVAYCADAAPETIAQATSETTKVTWAYGALIQQWASAIGTLAFAAVAWLLRLLPGQIYAVLVAARADQLLQKAIDYGINMVQGAAKDRSLTVDVHNEVLAKALQFVIDNAPGWLQSWMGGPEKIAEKIVARLNIAPDDKPPDVNAAVASAVVPAK